MERQVEPVAQKTRLDQPPPSVIHVHVEAAVGQRLIDMSYKLALQALDDYASEHWPEMKELYFPGGAGFCCEAGGYYQGPTDPSLAGRTPQEATEALARIQSVTEWFVFTGDADEKWELLSLRDRNTVWKVLRTLERRSELESERENEVDGSSSSSSSSVESPRLPPELEFLEYCMLE